MKMMIEVLNLPDMEDMEGATLLNALRSEVICALIEQGYPFGSGYSVWGFYDD